MRKTSLVLVVLIWISAATSATAIGKVTTDPNTSGAGAANAQAQDKDARLDQNVTYEARRKTVRAILTDLTKLTGVMFRAGYNDLDWQVRDRKMSIFATDTSLRSLMDSISHVMKFRWSRREADGTWIYRLYMDRTTLLGAERQALLEENRLYSIEAEQRARLTDDLTEAAAMSDDELERLREDNPALYVYAKQGWQDLLPSLFRDIPEAAQAWSAGDALILNAASLPTGVQQAVNEALRKMGQFFARVGAPKMAPSSETTSHLDKVQIRINQARSLYGYRGDTFIGDITVTWPGGGLNTTFTNLDSEVAKAIARDCIRQLDGESASQTNAQRIQAVQEQKTDFGEPLIEHADDPSLAVKVKLKAGGPRFEDLLAAVAKASGLTVVSDSFRIDYSGLGIGSKEVQLRDVLDRIASGCRYNWQKQNSTLEFRDRDWFRKRSAQVPESWLEPWRTSLSHTGTLDIKQLGQIALLDSEQLRENITPDDVLGGMGLPVLLFSYGGLLRAYGCLTPDQQEAVFSDEGFDLAGLSSSQWTTVARFLRENSASADYNNPAGRIQGKCERKGKQFLYTFTITPSTGHIPLKWSFTTPKYDLTNKINSLPWVDAGPRVLDVFEEAQKAKLPDLNAWLKVGVVLYDGKYYSQALEALGQVIGSTKTQPIVRFAAFAWRGHVLDLTNHRDDAIAAYKAALGIDIGNSSMGYSLYDMVIDRKWVEERLKKPFERND